MKPSLTTFQYIHQFHHSVKVLFVVNNRLQIADFIRQREAYERVNRLLELLRIN